MQKFYNRHDQRKDALKGTNTVEGEETEPKLLVELPPLLEVVEQVVDEAWVAVEPVVKEAWVVFEQMVKEVGVQIEL